MIAMPLRPGRLSIDLQSGGGLWLKKRTEASRLLFVRCIFFRSIHHPFSLSLSVSEELLHDVYQREVDFQNITSASNWLRTRAEMRDTFPSANYRAASGKAAESRRVEVCVVCFTFWSKVVHSCGRLCPSAGFISPNPCYSQVKGSYLIYFELTCNPSECA